VRRGEALVVNQWTDFHSNGRMLMAQAKRLHSDGGATDNGGHTHMALPRGPLGEIPLISGQAFLFGNSAHAYVLKNVLVFKDYLPFLPGMCY
jgi:hypothetical protein